MNKHVEFEQPGIIVLGGHIQALGIIRILGRRGIKSVIIDKTKKNISRHSKYCDLFILCKDDELLSRLMSLGQEKKYQNWVLFPTNDFHVKVLSQNRNKLQKYFIVSTDCWKVIDAFYNKRNTYKIVDKIGVPFPKTWFPDSISDLATINVKFPCIIKPAVMHDFYKFTKQKVFICKDKNELFIKYNIALKIIPSTEIIVQEIIPGSSNNQFSACFLFINRKSYAYITACRMRQHPIDFGNATTYAETVDLPILKEYSEKILNEANYSGICEVEFKFDDRDNTYKFLEVNPRTWKWHTIANKTKTPFLWLFYNYLIGKTIEPVSDFSQASFFHFITDFPTAFRLFFKGSMLWARLKRPIENAVWTTDDIKPWIYEKIYLFNLIKTR